MSEGRAYWDLADRLDRAKMRLKQYEVNADYELALELIKSMEEGRWSNIKYDDVPITIREWFSSRGLQFRIRSDTGETRIILGLTSK